MIYAGIVFLLFCSAFFSAAEIAFAGANTGRLRQAAERGKKRDKWALYIKENYNQALCSILMGNNLVNIAASQAAAVLAMQAAGEMGAAYSTVVMTGAILVFGEITPKQFSRMKGPLVARLSAAPLYALIRVTKPVVSVVLRVVSVFSRLWGGKKAAETNGLPELRAAIEVVEEEGVIDSERGGLLQSALSFGQRCAADVLTPRVDVSSLDIEMRPEEVVKFVTKARFSRFPVYQDSIDNIKGILTASSFLRAVLDNEAPPPLAALLEPAKFAHKSQKLPSLLAEMRRENVFLTIVIDDFGGLAGIITVEDILEDLVGDIWDETDKPVQRFRETSPGVYEVDGSISIEELFSSLKLPPPQTQAHTAGGWAQEEIGGIPRRGSRFAYRNLQITVTGITGRRVRRLLVEASNL